MWNIRHSLHAIKSERLNTAVVILFGRMMSARANSIIYNSRTSSRQHERFGYCCTNSDYIPNGFDCSEYKPDEGSRSKLIHELSLDADSLIIGHAGRYHRMKDHKTMLIAASFLAKLYGKAHFVFVGSGVNGNNLELANLINEYALNGRVSLLGERKDLSGIYPALDLFVSSSYSESFSNVVAEAMSCGIPCVVTDVGDLASIVNDTGYVVSTGDPYALANAIKKMIVMGSEKRAKLGSMARARIKEHYSLDRILNKYEAIYQKLISEPDKSLNKYNKVVERSGVL